MKKRYICIVIILFSLCWTCSYHKITHLSQDELSYIAYSELDTLFFLSNRFNVDTVIISEITVNNSLNPFNPFGFETSYDYEANVSVTLKVFHQGTKFDGMLLVKKINQDSDAVITAYLGNRFSNDFVPKFNKTCLSNVTIDDCIYINCSNSSISKNIHYMKNSITSFVWSRSKGLMEYSFDNGELYKLQEMN